MEGREKPNKVAGFVQLSRPFTLIAPASGVFAGGLMALAFYGRLGGIGSRMDLIFILGIASLLYAMINSASNALNQVTDLEIDRINKPSRPIPSGVITVREATKMTNSRVDWIKDCVTNIDMIRCRDQGARISSKTRALIWYIKTVCQNFIQTNKKASPNAAIALY